MKIGILASGDLGLHTLKSIANRDSIQFIATDSNSLPIIEWATELKIQVYKGNPRNGKLKKFIGTNLFDLILSINYLFIIEKDIIDSAKYPINLHGSLLPKYRGRTPHVWAIINGEDQTGVSAHIINLGCDTGDIVLQRKIPITFNKTGADILQEYKNIYPEIISEIIKLAQTQKLSAYKQDHSKATFFGKRTPEDGEINWNWSKERIRNWVRAQSYPYPGAFINFKSERIIIDWCEFSDLGFSYDDRNGTVLMGGSRPIIKSANGAIELSKIRNYSETLKRGDIIE